VLDFNVVTPFTLVAALVPGMVQRGSGAIVNVSTMVASFGLPGMSAYGASKAALELLTKAWAAEYGPAGVRVNAVSPGPTRTPGTAAMGEEGIKQLAATLPLGRAADASEIANTIVYLASDDASFINGAIVPVDGGRVAV
jgi:NAD(P)-dependent dehydrogenase (short-subunit alcohol dehydrogenase family)